MNTNLPVFPGLANIPDPTLLSMPRDCPTCLGRHDEAIHAATLSVRRWFREEVTKGFGVSDLTGTIQN
jgi:hypothetical protein